MVPVAKAQRLIAAHNASLPAEPISSLTADGRVLSENIFANEKHSRYRQSNNRWLCPKRWKFS